MSAKLRARQTWDSLACFLVRARRLVAAVRELRTIPGPHVVLPVDTGALTAQPAAPAFGLLGPAGDTYGTVPEAVCL